ncbi:hypothetical protein [Paenibacillus monticola]|uniref:HEAT repeat domain-containing protein n=1 Tax=Paenibacillus monticola TaxID=2666075 RepID=A0A7X2H4J5_9BACL|nr:hypothetical protein [Paenibacillus monticola]MRN52593.1 hypothetical protein [Paenibacillus monticola]
MSGLKNTLAPFQQWINDKEQWEDLAGYMRQESNLPGPRANLGLAESFAQLYSHSAVTEIAWDLLLVWANIAEADAGTNEPREFLPFNAVCAAGAYYGYAEEERRCVIQAMIQSAMNDSRWRMREAAAMSMQNIGEFDFSLLRQLLDTWRVDANMLEQRAFVAALAHPPLLKIQENTVYCLNLAAGIMEELLLSTGVPSDREHFRVLSKGLEYSLSVFVASEPEAGFAMLRRFAESGDARISKIVKSNLGKTRLSKKYDQQVADLLLLMGLTRG